MHIVARFTIVRISIASPGSRIQAASSAQQDRAGGWQCQEEAIHAEEALGCVRRGDRSRGSVVGGPPAREARQAQSN
eukprot:5804996-Alexandrium_andersonii.AAC.1